MKSIMTSLVLGILVLLVWTIIDGRRSTSEQRSLPDALTTPRLPISGVRSEARLAELSATPVKSLLNIRTPMRFGEYVWHETGVPTGPASIAIDLSNQTISLFRAGHEIGTAVILYGAEGKPTPVGAFSILAKHEKHRSSLYDVDMPYTLRLTDYGIAIHASDVRERRATHGCVGVPLAFAARLFEQMKVGDPVRIIRL